jgi:hypothetical protein
VMKSNQRVFVATLTTTSGESFMRTDRGIEHSLDRRNNQKARRTIAEALSALRGRIVRVSQQLFRSLCMRSCKEQRRQRHNGRRHGSHRRVTSRWCKKARKPVRCSLSHRVTALTEPTWLPVSSAFLAPTSRSGFRRRGATQAAPADPP